ncbi:MAG: flagellar hook-length control protein FliK [Legionella sp.]|uniref:flagellar hook-length control protein FliK n=1 Tax=Legionella sp. TaxID=459 RepID=UPI00283ADC88|nr:flagellar hook-length control protein FliK [Legionella sp.]
MLDLNNSALSSLFILNSQESIEPKQINATQEKELQDDNSIDPSTFLFLLAQVTPDFADETQNDSAKSDSVNFIESEAAKSKSAQEPSPDALNTEFNANLEENVAVTWINSEYYQAGRNSSSAISATEAGQIATVTELSKNLIPEMQVTQIEGHSSTEMPSALFALELQDTNPPEVKTNEQMRLSTFNVEPDLAQVDIDKVGLKDLEINKQEATSDVLAEDSQPSTARGISANNALPIAPVNSKNQNDLSSEENDIEYFESSDFDIDNLPRSKMEQPISEFTLSRAEANSPEHPGAVDRSLASHVINNLEPNSAISSKQVERSTSMSSALAIPLDIDDPQWSKQFSDHVMWLGQQGIKNATIRIHPEELGPLEISIKVVNDSASVNIISHSQQVRDIIDQSVSRLHAMMAEQGLNLSEFNIDSDEGTRQFAQQHEGSSQEEAGYFNEAEDEVVFTPIKNKAKPQGVIDYFA